MSCILRFWGKEFNPKQAIEDIPVVADKLWAAGERRFPESQKLLSINKSSGVNFLVSDAEFSELPKQIEDAIAFLGSHYIWLARLASAPGLEGQS